MADSRSNIRTAVVVMLACLACVFFGYLMGLTAPRPRAQAETKAREGQENVIRIASTIDASLFDEVSGDIMTQPETRVRSVQGMPLKMVKIKLADILRSDMDKRDVAVLEKRMMNVNEAVFYDFSDVPADVVTRFKVELLPYLEFVSEEGYSDPSLNCIFCLTEDGGKTLSSLVMLLSYSNLQMVRFIGQMDPSIVDVLTDLR